MSVILLCLMPISFHLPCFCFFPTSDPHARLSNVFVIVDERKHLIKICGREDELIDNKHENVDDSKLPISNTQHKRSKVKGGEEVRLYYSQGLPAQN